MVSGSYVSRLYLPGPPAPGRRSGLTEPERSDSQLLQHPAVNCGCSEQSSSTVPPPPFLPPEEISVSSMKYNLTPTPPLSPCSFDVNANSSADTVSATPERGEEKDPLERRSPVLTGQVTQKGPIKRSCKTIKHLQPRIIELSPLINVQSALQVGFTPASCHVLHHHSCGCSSPLSPSSSSSSASSCGQQAFNLLSVESAERSHFQSADRLELADSVELLQRKRHMKDEE